MEGARHELEGQTILIVEDLYLVGEDLRCILEHAGAHTIGPVASTSQAIAISVGQHLDGAVLDVRLRDETSEIVAKALARQGVQFIVVTGCVRDAIPEALSKGIFLPKPVTRGPLLEAALTLFS